MSLRKIEDFKPTCMATEHNPPVGIYLPPGKYEWTCSACGFKTEFVVQAYHLGDGVMVLGARQ